MEIYCLITNANTSVHKPKIGVRKIIYRTKYDPDSEKQNVKISNLTVGINYTSSNLLNTGRK